MIAEFKSFITRGNVLDLAVAVIIGAAFATIIMSLTDDLIMPLIAAIFGNLDFANRFVLLGPVPVGYSGPMTYAALKEAGVPMLGYGRFLSALVNFLILAFAVFLLVRAAARAAARREIGAEAVIPEDIILLREIRDELKRRP